jgi:hypothetical protein
MILLTFNAFEGYTYRLFTLLNGHKVSNINSFRPKRIGFAYFKIQNPENLHNSIYVTISKEDRGGKRLTQSKQNNLK